MGLKQVKTDIKALALYGVAFIVVEFLLNCGIFVTYPSLTAYAVSKDTFEMVLDKLDALDKKIDNIQTKVDTIQVEMKK